MSEITDEEPNLPVSSETIENEDNEIPIGNEVFKTIWKQPTATFAQLFAAKSNPWVKKRVNILMALSGISIGLYSITLPDNYESLNAYYVLTGLFENTMLALLKGLFVSLVLLNLDAAFLYLSGKKILKSEVTLLDYRIVLAFAEIPVIASSILFYIYFLTYGIKSFFESTFLDVFSTIFGIIAVLGSILLSCWSFVLFVLGVYVLQSYDKAITAANIIFATLLLGGLFFGLFYFILRIKLL